VQRGLLLEFINRQGQAGKTVIPAKHDLGILETIARRVYVLGEEHQLVAKGSLQQILADKALLVSSYLMRPV
jgi:energy-coupling factor transporter ATP-binding protein EcfA2